MYYIWKHMNDKITKKDFVCGIEQFEDWSTISWKSGEKIDRKLPEILNYYTESKLFPNDYPKTGSNIQLISEKIFTILEDLNAGDYESFQSQIVLPDGKTVKGYYSLNILNVVDCLDRKKSIIKEKQYGPGKLLVFKKLCLDYKKIPTKIKLFRLGKSKTKIIIHEDIRRAFKAAGVTGVTYEHLCIERPGWLIGYTNFYDEEE